MTKTKIALAVMLFAATSSAAFAQSSGKLRGLQLAPAAALQSAPVHLKKHRKAVLRSAPVRLRQRDVALPRADTPAHAGPIWYRSSGPTSGGM